MKITDKLSSGKMMLVLTYLGLYLLSTGASIFIFSFLKSGPAVSMDAGSLEEVRSRINAELPRTEECPINGGMFTKIERSIWELRRPILTIIENHAEARPQSGLSRADVIYEAVAEGGITRFLAVFFCGAAREDVKVAPVRSARVYFIDWAAAYGKNPIFMHVGGANDYAGYGDTAKEARALELLETLGWRVPRGNDFDTTYDSGFPVLWRDYERLDHPVATEHTMVASLDEAYRQAEARKLTDKDEKGVSWDIDFKPWKFEDGKAKSQVVSEIKFNFWEGMGDYGVSWKYNPAENVYTRFNGGKQQVDLNNNEPLTARNIAIIFTKETNSVDRNKHVLYQTIGDGEALVFQNGTAIEGNWKKTSRNDRIVFTDERGSEISFVRGPIWIEVLAIGSEVDY